MTQFMDECIQNIKVFPCSADAWVPCGRVELHDASIGMPPSVERVAIFILNASSQDYLTNLGIEKLNKSSKYPIYQEVVTGILFPIIVRLLLSHSISFKERFVRSVAIFFVTRKITVWYNRNMKIPDGLNIRKSCAQYRVGLWECPQFLFVVMGIIIIGAILVTYTLAQQYADDPEVAALIVLILAAILFIIGQVIVSSFERIARFARAKSEFISIMSHELRSPLSAIKWQIDVLLSDKSLPHGTSSGTAHYLETIGEQNERMIHAVNDLLEVNRIEDHDIVLRPSSFSLGDLTKQVVSRYQRYASANNVTFALKLLDGASMVNADEERIKGVVEHLIDNAIRYSVQGGTVTIIIDPTEDIIRWEITDQGIGIVSEERNRVFQKFFRSPSIMRHQTEGAGVGLFIAKSIVTMSGGSMGFDSQLNKGSKFWFTLPRGK